MNSWTLRNPQGFYKKGFRKTSSSATASTYAHQPRPIEDWIPYNTFIKKYVYQGRTFDQHPCPNGYWILKNEAGKIWQNKRYKSEGDCKRALYQLRNNKTARAHQWRIEEDAIAKEFWIAKTEPWIQLTIPGLNQD
jgi:hypothetical protein